MAVFPTEKFHILNYLFPLKQCALSGWFLRTELQSTVQMQEWRQMSEKRRLLYLQRGVDGKPLRRCLPRGILWKTLHGILFVSISAIRVPCGSRVYLPYGIRRCRLFDAKSKLHGTKWWLVQKFISFCDARIKQNNNFAGHSAGITWGIIVALLLVGVIVLVLVHYRRRVQNLKTEIAHVQYIADPGSQPDRHHFDNPVYAFGTAPPNIPDSTTLLNNLRPHKPTNLDRHKLGYSDTDSVASSRGIQTTQFSISQNMLHNFHSSWSLFR